MGYFELTLKRKSFIQQKESVLLALNALEVASMFIWKDGREHLYKSNIFTCVERALASGQIRDLC